MEKHRQTPELTFAKLFIFQAVIFIAAILGIAGVVWVVEFLGEMGV